MATYPDGSRHLVAAGGDAFSLGDDASTWIYDLDMGIDIWRPGPKLDLSFGESVPFKNSFLAVGGIDESDPEKKISNQIWEFNADPFDEKWIRRPETLKSNRVYISAFLVPDDFATCP